DQRGVGLTFIPTIRISHPLAGLTREKPSLNALARSWIACLPFERKRLHQDRAIRQVPHRAVVRQRHESLRLRAVHPGRRVYRIRNQGRLNLVIFRGNEEPCLTQPRWEFWGMTLAGSSDQAVNSTAVIG